MSDKSLPDTNPPLADFIKVVEGERGQENPEVIRATELVAFIAKKDERIADLERQLAEARLEADKKTRVIRYYEDTLCCPMSTEISLDHGVKAKEISPVKIKELLEAYEAVRKKAHDACKILTLSMARGLKDEKRPTWKEFCIAFEALDAICDEKPNE